MNQRIKVKFKLSLCCQSVLSVSTHLPMNSTNEEKYIGHECDNTNGESFVHKGTRKSCRSKDHGVEENRRDYWPKKESEQEKKWPVKLFLVWEHCCTSVGRAIARHSEGRGCAILPSELWFWFPEFTDLCHPCQTGVHAMMIKLFTAICLSIYSSSEKCIGVWHLHGFSSSSYRSKTCKLGCVVLII